jgi:hypothetical protein
MFLTLRAGRLGLWCVAFVVASGCAVAQSPAPTDQDSCRRFVQAFYDWYAPLTRKETSAPAWERALRERRDAFTLALWQALENDARAQAQAHGDIVGIDFDPFLGSQDPAAHYRVRQVTVQGGKCSAGIWQGIANGAAKSAPPDAVAELIHSDGHWRFTNVRYPELKTDLLTVLAQTADERRKARR